MDPYINMNLENIEFNKLKWKDIRIVEDTCLTEDQSIGNIFIKIGDPFSRIEFNVEDSIPVFFIVWGKICGGFSKKNDFKVYINNKEIELTDMPDFFQKNASLILTKNKNKLIIENLFKKNITKLMYKKIIPIVDPY